VATEPGRLRRTYRRFLAWVRLRVPPGLRLVLGFGVMIGGFLGFLPIVGFWMIPLGVAIMALDLRPLWRKFWISR